MSGVINNPNPLEGNPPAEEPAAGPSLSSNNPQMTPSANLTPDTANLPIDPLTEYPYSNPHRLINSDTPPLPLHHERTRFVNEQIDYMERMDYTDRELLGEFRVIFGLWTIEDFRKLDSVRKGALKKLLRLRGI